MTLQFHNRDTFDSAVAILCRMQKDLGEQLFVGSFATMTITIHNDIGKELGIEELALCKITNKQSFLGIPDFEII